jgi:hypothetical protein
MKSIRKQLIYTSVLIDSLKLTRHDLTAINVYSWGDVSISMKAAAFARVLTMLGVSRSKVTFTVTESYVHASFKSRGVEWSCSQKMTTEQLDELLAHPTPALELTPTPRISQKQPRLEFAE